jgi:hypothetical protein
MLKRHWWLLATTAIFAAGAANAQSPTPDLERQMEQLQEQMKQVKSELVEAPRLPSPQPPSSWLLSTAPMGPT